jgi:hypothetical protein
MMRILNIDLDFFLNDRAHGRADDPNSRPDDWGLTPWKADEVVKYLEGALKLKEKTPGRVVQSHHEVFYHWRELIEREALSTPFFICHVDAHSDLGMGMPAWVYLHSEFLELPLPARRFPVEGKEGLNFGSYMSFAIGNRWFSEIDFIVPPFWRDDIPQFLLTDKCTSSEFVKANQELEIELMYAPRQQIKGHFYTPGKFIAIRKSVGEPRIPLHVIAQQSAAGRYEGRKWDYVYLSRSPGYTPTKSDALIPVIAEYIDVL